ncbi:MAG: hypothetical protein KF750_14295 [Xanthobacteraceae bacterium]|nr:hypothetical protein [Xanthobacteraceae bacterium]
MRIAAIALLAFMLAACVTSPMPQTAKAVCDIFTDPGYAVKGKTKRDQFWIDSQLEGGYASCGWQRPKREGKK